MFLLLWLVYHVACAWQRTMEDGGLLRLMFAAIKSIPRVKSYIQKEKEKLRESIRASRKTPETLDAATDGPTDGDRVSSQTGVKSDGEAIPLLAPPTGPMISIPQVGLPVEDVIDLLKLKAGRDVKFREGQSML